MSFANARSTVSVTSRQHEPSPDAPDRRWGLIGLTGFAAVLGLQSLFGDWLTYHLEVSEVAKEDSESGIAYFGALSIGYAVGMVVMVALVALTLWRPARFRTGLAWAALGLGLLLLVDLALVIRQVHDVLDHAAGTVARLRGSMETLPAVADFHVRSPALYGALTATLLLLLTAAQLVAPYRSIQVQAVSGAVLAFVAAGLPWTLIWVIESSTSDVPYEQWTEWPWSGGVQGLLLIGQLLLLLVVVVGCLRAPGYARARWAVAGALLAGLVFFSVQVFETDSRVEAFALRNKVSEVLEVSSTGAGPLFAIGAVLLALAAVRSWWHGREEIPEPTSDEGWLPDRLRDRREGGRPAVS
jgi:hypothetical protein